MSRILPHPSLLFHDLYIRIDPSKIAFMKFIIEGYDGLAILTTIDRHEGLLRLLVPISRYEELCRLLAELSPTCRLSKTVGVR